MNIAICDDDKTYADVLEEALSKLSGSKTSIDVFYSGSELAKEYDKKNANYDVIFLDMEMKGLNGIETANYIRKTDRCVIIVFVTSHDQYMKESFQCSPFRFLIKPVEPVAPKEINKVWHEIIAKLSEEKKTFSFYENRDLIRLFCADIMFFESNGHALIIYTRTETYECQISITKLMKMVDGEVFVRIHKSFVVNLNYVKKIAGNEIEIHEYGGKLPIGRLYRKTFMKSFIDFEERKYLL